MYDLQENESAAPESATPDEFDALPDDAVSAQSAEPHLRPEMLRALSAASRALGEAQGVRSVLELVSALSVGAVLGVDEASVTVRRPNGRLEMIAPTGAMAERADQLQFQTGGGPCIDVVRSEQRRIRADDIAADERWPALRRMAGELAVRSILSIRLSGDDDEGAVEGLNLYSRTPHAFAGVAELSGELFGAHAAVALRAARHREQVVNLHRALETNRDIGVAMGIIMARRLVTRGQAYELLRRASQHSQRKLADIAAEVADIGILEFDPT
ncbi:MAG: hypothetical protein QOK11_3132 [Pseudonocardiales bacterium]|nr:hypothetical protein [Pseudonocardiales bacterium]